MPGLGLRASPSGCNSDWELGTRDGKGRDADCSAGYVLPLGTAGSRNQDLFCAFQTAPCLHNKLHSSSPLEFLGIPMVQIIVEVP